MNGHWPCMFDAIVTLWIMLFSKSLLIVLFHFVSSLFIHISHIHTYTNISPKWKYASTITGMHWQHCKLVIFNGENDYFYPRLIHMPFNENNELPNTWGYYIELHVLDITTVFGLGQLVFSFFFFFFSFCSSFIFVLFS